MRGDHIGRDRIARSLDLRRRRHTASGVCGILS